MPLKQPSVTETWSLELHWSTAGHMTGCNERESDSLLRCAVPLGSAEPFSNFQRIVLVLWLFLEGGGRLAAEETPGLLMLPEVVLETIRELTDFIILFFFFTFLKNETHLKSSPQPERMCWSKSSDRQLDSEQSFIQYRAIINSFTLKLTFGS